MASSWVDPWHYFYFETAVIYTMVEIGGAAAGTMIAFGWDIHRYYSGYHTTSETLDVASTGENSPEKPPRKMNMRYIL